MKIKRFGSRTSFSGWYRNKRGKLFQKIPLVRSFGSLNASWPDAKRIRIYDAQENRYFTTTVAEYRDNWWMLD